MIDTCVAYYLDQKSKKLSNIGAMHINNSQASEINIRKISVFR